MSIIIDIIPSDSVQFLQKQNSFPNVYHEQNHRQNHNYVIVTRVKLSVELDALVIQVVEVGGVHVGDTLGF